MSKLNKYKNLNADHDDDDTWNPIVVVSHSFIESPKDKLNCSLSHVISSWKIVKTFMKMQRLSKMKLN